MPFCLPADDPDQAATDKDVMVYQASGLVTTVTTLALDSDDDLLTGCVRQVGLYYLVASLGDVISTGSKLQMLWCPQSVLHTH